MNRRLKTGILIAAITILMAMPVFAGQWVQDDNGWWYDNGDGMWPSETWKWIDGNGDGIAECYYFNGNGYMLKNTSVMGYSVDENGAYVIDGIVQTRKITEADGTIVRYYATDGQTIIVQYGNPLIITINGYGEEGWFEYIHEAEWIDEGVRARAAINDSCYRDFIFHPIGLTVETYEIKYGYMGSYQDGWYDRMTIS